MIASDKEKHYLSLIAIKDNGGLLFPSEDIVRIVVSEKYFKAVVTGIEGHKINASKNLRSKLTVAIIAKQKSFRARY